MTKQHKCKSIKEYRSILGVYNSQSAMYFNGLNRIHSEAEKNEYLKRHPNKRFGVKIA